MAAPKIAHHIFLGVASFLVRDHDATLAAEQGQTTRHCFVIRKPAVAMQFNPTGKTPFDIIQRESPLRMSRDFDTLPGRKDAMDPSSRVVKPCLQALYR